MSLLSKLPFFKWGTIDYQVKYYVRKYYNCLKKGYSINDAINNIMDFYLRGESYDRKVYMEEKFNDYVNQFELLICDIMIFYFHFDDSKHYPVKDIVEDTQHYLEKYKYQFNNEHCKKAKISRKAILKLLKYIGFALLVLMYLLSKLANYQEKQSAPLPSYFKYDYANSDFNKKYNHDISDLKEKINRIKEGK